MNHLTPENPPDVFHDMRDFYGAMPVTVQRRIDFSTPPPPSPVPPPGVLPSGPPPEPPTQLRLPPPRPPPPNFARAASPVSPAREESPESPGPSEPYSPTDTPTRRIQPASPPWSPDRLHCDQSLYVARQDHVFALPRGCPDHPETPPRPYSASNPPLQPPPEPRRRRAPPPPQQRERNFEKASGGRGLPLSQAREPAGATHLFPESEEFIFRFRP